jgi:hypothetical protein
VAEAKVASYILKKTRKNVEVLDPTGNAPWFPSQEALEKDWKFGTGKAEPAAVEMLQKKYQQLVRSFSLLPCFFVGSCGRGSPAGLCA